MLVYVKQTTQHHIPEDCNCNTHHKNLKWHKYRNIINFVLLYWNVRLGVAGPQKWG